MVYRLLADTALYLHFAFVLFVVLGLVAILVGGVRGWAWVRNRPFRTGHLAAIGVVVAQAWLGILCPLTHLEVWARERAGEATYTGSFVSHWVERALYYRAPAWAFIAAYTLFAALVVVAWIRVPPARRG
jgi:polyferredoxin